MFQNKNKIFEQNKQFIIDDLIRKLNYSFQGFSGNELAGSLFDLFMHIIQKEDKESWIELSTFLLEKYYLKNNLGFNNFIDDLNIGYRTIINSLQKSLTNEPEKSEILIQVSQKCTDYFVEFSKYIHTSLIQENARDRKIDTERPQENQQLIQNILEDAAIAIFVLDENSHVTLWNKQAAIMYGYSAEEIIGKPITVIVPKDSKYEQEIMKINEIVKEKGFVKDWETERITRDGRKIKLIITRSAIFNTNEKYIGSSVIARDITEQRRLEQQLIQSEKLSAVGQLAAGIAHEVGSPLTAISSLAQLLYETSTDASTSQKLKMIREQIDRITRIVRELVNFSKPISTTVGEVSVNKVIEEAVQIVKYDKRLKLIKIDIDLLPALPLIKVSFDQLLQVLVNILLNAGDALEKNPNGKIFINTRLVGEKIITTIMDNGGGISKENIDKIFDPFFTTKNPGKGTGLGLWVCYNIVKGFSGEILVESEINKGTAFHIVLPVINKLDEENHEKENYNR